MNRQVLASALIVFAGSAFAFSASAQQVNLDAPFHSVGHSYYEQIGVRWGLRGNGWFFNFGGPPPAPQFGGFDPNAGATFGFGGPNGFFNVTAGQGSNRSMVSSTPSVTVMNGGTGYFADTVQRPFVTGLVPVVGSPLGVPAVFPPYAPPQSVLAERLHRLQTEGATPSTAGASTPPPSPLAGEGPGVRGSAATSPSSAERGDISVAEIKAAKAAEKSAKYAALQEEIAVLIEKANGKIEAGQASVAKVYLQMAARKATGEQQAEILARLKSLEPAAK